jgi:hypothetical protein
MPTYVAGTDVLAFVGIDTPTSFETTWSDLCAGAVQSAFNVRLSGVTITDPSPQFTELKVAARLAAAEAFKRREATFGVTGYSDLNNAAIRVARDYVTGVEPIISRYTLRGPIGGIG